MCVVCVVYGCGCVDRSSMCGVCGWIGHLYVWCVRVCGCVCVWMDRSSMCVGGGVCVGVDRSSMCVCVGVCVGGGGWIGHLCV